MRPGEAFAVDGTIEAGTGFVSEAAVRGEPFAAVKRQGDAVLAGSVSADSLFTVRATSAGSERQIDRLIAAVETARRENTAWQPLADALARWFVPTILIIATLTFYYWSNVEGWQVGLFRAMSVLLVACPCAIGLATPVVVWSALSRLAERGVVASSGRLIENLARVDYVVFDKTGTLTETAFGLADLVTQATGEDRARLLSRLAALEANASHPVAAPFAALPRAYAVVVEELRTVPGCGVEGTVRDDDTGERHFLRVGRPEWLGDFDEFSARLLADDGGRIGVEQNGELAALAVVSERLRGSAAEAIAAFARLGMSAEVLTGDRAGRAETLGLPSPRSNLSPIDKERRVEELKSLGRWPLFVGDGINDASALASATAGIAISSGTDLAIGAAQATAYHGDLRVLPWAVELSRHALAVLRRNFAVALGYNLVGVALAASGHLHPLAAALAHGLFEPGRVMVLDPCRRAGPRPLWRTPARHARRSDRPRRGR